MMSVSRSDHGRMTDDPGTTECNVNAMKHHAAKTEVRHHLEIVTIAITAMSRSTKTIGETPRHHISVGDLL